MQSLRSKLPPPNALVAFEAAARHLSFTSAAGELNVTRVAVSNQVKQLEEFLGVELFVRLHRTLRLTTAGDILGRRLSTSLGEIAATVEAISQDQGNLRLTITTSTGFVTYWLLPRISDFRSRHPDVDLRFLVSDSYINLESEGVDVAIRYGSGSWRGLRVERLLTEVVFVVCSPRLLDGPAPIASPAASSTFSDWKPPIRPSSACPTRPCHWNRSTCPVGAKLRAIICRSAPSRRPTLNTSCPRDRAIAAMSRPMNLMEPDLMRPLLPR